MIVSLLLDQKMLFHKQTYSYQVVKTYLKALVRKLNTSRQYLRFFYFLILFYFLDLGLVSESQRVDFVMILS